MGPADSDLARVAAAARLWSEAEEHFDPALAACERIGARATAARTRWWYAEMLRARGGVEDAPRAAELEALARADASELDLAL